MGHAPILHNSSIKRKTQTQPNNYSRAVKEGYKRSILSTFSNGGPGNHSALILRQSGSAHVLSDTGQTSGQGTVSTQASTFSCSAGAKSVHKQGSVQKQKQGSAGVIIKEKALLKPGSK